MRWESLLMGAAAGLLSALIAAAIVRRPKERRGAYATVFVVCFAVLYGISRTFVSPVLEERRVEAALLKLPVYRVIKQYEPAAYRVILAKAKRLRAEGQQAFDATVHAEIAKIASARVKSASDEAVILYMRATVQEMRELDALDGDACYRFLVPARPGDGPTGAEFTPETKAMDQEGLAAVIRSSAENPQRVPAEAEVMPRLDAVLDDMVREFGNDLALLNRAPGTTDERRRYCKLVIGLYARVLSLPAAESGPLLRFILSQK